MSKSKSNNQFPAVFLRYTDQTEHLPEIDPDNLFFTADTHFYCYKVLPYRPQFKDIDEMNETLIRLWNETVPEDAVVFHLGDLASHLPRDIATELIRGLRMGRYCWSRAITTTSAYIGIISSGRIRECRSWAIIGASGWRASKSS